LRCLGAYLVIAALGVPVGRALAEQRRPAASVSAQGPTSLGPVLLAGTSSGPAASVHNPSDSGPHAFTMSGGVGGLLPGRWTTLPVLVTNPNSQPIKVLTISATAKDASPACPAAANLSVLRYDATAAGATSYLVPGRGSLLLPLPIQLINVPNRNQNACKGVSFGLSFVGSAVQWEK
jgi:hypothetical protein